MKIIMLRLPYSSICLPIRANSVIGKMIALETKKASKQAKKKGGVL